MEICVGKSCRVWREATGTGGTSLWAFGGAAAGTLGAAGRADGAAPLDADVGGVATVVGGWRRPPAAGRWRRPDQPGSGRPKPGARRPHCGRRRTEP